jgi:hypothetical protein
MRRDTPPNKALQPRLSVASRSLALAAERRYVERTEHMRNRTRTEVCLWAILALTVAVHLLGFIPFVQLRLSRVWPLIFLPMGAFLRAFASVFGLSRKEYENRFDAMPRSAHLACWATFVYALLLFSVGEHFYRGSPGMTPSGFVLTDHGQVVASISELQYWEASRLEVAFIFGFLVMFAYLAVAMYTYMRKPLPAHD